MAEDLFMLDLFRTEARTHAESLSQGLVALESETDVAALPPERIEPLMRAAHSIKGAARIVGLDRAVTLAHEMEDILVAAQKGKLVLTPARVDVLLSAVDVFSRLAQSEATGMVARLAELEPDIAALLPALAALPLTPDAPPEAKAPAEPSAPPPSPEAVAAQATPQAPALLPEPTPEPAPTAAPTAAQAPVQGSPAPAAPPQPQAQPGGPAQHDGMVRVSTRNLDRIMAFAGEYLIESAHLVDFTRGLHALKDGHRALSKALDGLLEAREGEGRVVREAAARCAAQLAGLMSGFEAYSRRADNLVDRLYNEVVQSRMRPFSEGCAPFPRTVRDLARSLGKKARLEMRGQDTRVDRDILERLEAPLNHILRNAVDHGLETPAERLAAGKSEAGTIHLNARHQAGMLTITISDDGRGVDLAVIRDKVAERGLAGPEMAARMQPAELLEFLFLPGFSTARSLTEISGRGVGLDVVHAMVQEVGGTVRIESEAGRGSTFVLELPITLSVLRTLLVEVAGHPYAVPLTRIDRIDSVPLADIQVVEDRQYLPYEGQNIGLVSAAQILDFPVRPFSEHVDIVVVSDRMSRHALAVDRFLGEESVVVRPLDPRLGKVPDVQAVARLVDGSPVFILDVEDLVRSVDNLLLGGRLKKLEEETARKDVRPKRVLVVDDSLTVREVERKLLETKGYVVDTAVDGMDGLNAALAAPYDLVITDVDMPRLNGIELVKRLRSDQGLASLPVLIVSYKDREEDRLLGLEAGADAYLTKSSFDDRSLLAVVMELIGPALDTEEAR
jgi:two-component system sensor histidine kinase and response regulator WspE